MKSRAKSRSKLVAEEADEYEDNNNKPVFKHYDNKFFDMDSMAEAPKSCAIPMPNMEIQELQQYVTKCYDALYKDFNAFKSTVTNQLLSLQEEVQSLSFHNSDRNDDVFLQAVKESPSQYGSEAVEGRKDKFSQWHSKGQVKDYKEFEKTAAQVHHESRPLHRPESRSPVEEELIQHIPANAWSNFSATKASESSSQAAPFTQFPNAESRKQETTYLSRHLQQGCHSPNNSKVHEAALQQQSLSKARPGWSPGKSNDDLATAWREEAAVEAKEYDEAEEENEQAIAKMVNEYSKGIGRDRFTLHGWAASFLQQPADGQVPKVNKQYMKQEIHYKFNDKERASLSEDTRGGELRIEQSVAELEITSKRPLSKATSLNQDLKQANKNMTNYMNLIRSSKSTADHEKGDSRDLAAQQQNPDSRFPGKKCRGGIAWTVDELAEQKEQQHRAAN